MPRSSSPPRVALFRYAFWGFWFFLVPAAAAYGLVLWLSGIDVAGPIDDAARAQSVPAGIVAFTLFEGLLLHLRHHLPLSSRVSEGGPAGLPVHLRKRYEAARQLLADADRILVRHDTQVLERLGEDATREIRESLDRLRETLDAEHFDEARFEADFEAALEKTAEPLAPWRKGELREYAESIGVAILVALLLRAVVIEAFKIPSGSMRPTLQIGDHIFVSKFTYGPKLPLLDRRVLSDLPPERGDVIVFEFPDQNENNERQDYIKRVIAVPGDTLEVDGGHPIINGWRVPNCRVGLYEYDTEAGSGFGRRRGELYVEFLEDTAYLALYNEHRDRKRQGPYHVQEGEAWVLGDNRHNSSDSRAWWRGGKQGAGVPYANVKGRALIVWFPLGRMFVSVMGNPVLPEGASPEVVAGVERCMAQRPPRSQTRPPPPSPRP